MKYEIRVWCKMAALGRTSQHGRIQGLARSGIACAFDGVLAGMAAEMMAETKPQLQHLRWSWIYSLQGSPDRRTYLPRAPLFECPHPTRN